MEGGSEDKATVAEAAEIAGCSIGTFYRSIRLGYVPPGVYWRIGRNIYISRSRLSQWIKEGGSAGGKEISTWS